MSELALTPVETYFAGEDSLSPWHQIFCPPSLVKEREGHKPCAIRDDDFEDAAFASSHASRRYGDNLSNESGHLTHGHTGNRCELTPGGITPGVVRDELPYQRVAKGALEGFRAAIAQHTAKLRIQANTHPFTVAPTGHTPD